FLFPLFFILNTPATSAIYTLSLHDALPISSVSSLRSPWGGGRANRTTGPRAKVAAPGLHVRPKALASPRGRVPAEQEHLAAATPDRKSTRLNSSHVAISYAVFCLKKKNIKP